MNFMKTIPQSRQNWTRNTTGPPKGREHQECACADESKDYHPKVGTQGFSVAATEGIRKVQGSEAPTTPGIPNQEPIHGSAEAKYRQSPNGRQQRRENSIPSKDQRKLEAETTRKRPQQAMETTTTNQQAAPDGGKGRDDDGGKAIDHG